ncbi:DNA repair protein RadC [Candidatus Woesearchaeota archaeon]|nr:DNA repair protein RadC [Candidatus Woesearchaeota archaeon]
MVSVENNHGEDERPRERLIARGAGSLSAIELLSILLGTGTRGQRVAELASGILAEMPPSRLAMASVGELCRFRGVSDAKACSIIAAFELGRRASVHQERRRIRSAKDVAELLRPELGLQTREHFLGLYLDARNGLLCKRVITIGSLNASLVHPREIFKVAFQESAAAVVLAHNHPSGDPTPSDEDAAITRTLVKAGELLGIEVLDHVIVTQGGHFSFAESAPPAPRQRSSRGPRRKGASG